MKLYRGARQLQALVRRQHRHRVRAAALARRVSSDFVIRCRVPPSCMWRTTSDNCPAEAGNHGSPTNTADDRAGPGRGAGAGATVCLLALGIRYLGKRLFGARTA